MDKSKYFILVGVLLLFVILFVPLMSAELFFDDFNEFFQDNVTQITITINQNESQANLYLNTAGTSFDRQEIEITNETINGVLINKIKVSFDISNLLGDINGKSEIEEGSKIIQFNSLEISKGIGHIDGVINTTDHSYISFSGFSTKGFLNTTINNLDLDINLDDVNSVNNYLAKNPLANISGRHVIFNKTGNDYTLWNDRGYGDFSNDKLDNIRDKVKEGVEEININNLIEDIAPFLEENNVNFSFLGNLEMNYSVDFINLDQVKLKDGKYNLTVSVKKDDKIYYKNVTLILEGIKNTQDATGETTTVNDITTDVVLGVGSINVTKITIPNTISEDKEITLDMSALKIGNTVTPTKNFTLERQGTNRYSAILPAGTIITGDSTWDGKLILPTITTITSSAGTINVAVNMGSTQRLNFSKAVKVVLGGMNGKSALYKDSTGEHTISACVDATDTSAGSLVSGGECSLSSGTDLIIWTYHFTIFAAYTPSTTATGGGGRSTRDRTVSEPSPQTTSPTPTTPEPIEATPPAPTKGFFAAITGAIIGALGTGGSIVVIVFIVSVIGLVVILRIGRKAEDLKIKKAVENIETKKEVVQDSKIKRKGKRRKKVNEEGDQDET